MSFQVRLSRRAAKDLDRLNRNTQQRILKRLEDLAESPYEPRFSAQLTNQGGLRKSRVGGWRILFAVDVVTIERRGQVYNRL